MVAKFWKPHYEGRVLCTLCPRFCSIPEGKVGFCGVRKNIGGKLYSLNYGRLTARAIDPIEKKPLVHFKPGSWVYSISTAGCNFACQFCQNYDISQRRKVTEPYTSPEDLIEDVIASRADGLTGTYNEPVIQTEYLIDVMRLAKKNGLFTTWVTNGYITEEALEEVAPLLDAATVDFKGNANPEFYRKYMMVPSPDPIFTALEIMKEKGVHVEITNLVVPTPEGSRDEDVKKLARWVVDHLGEDVPMHFLRFHPDYRMLDTPPTPREQLIRYWNIAKGEGVKYVYIGNLWDPKYESTYCPNCGTLLIERHLYNVKIFLRPDASCPNCGHKTSIVL